MNVTNGTNGLPTLSFNTREVDPLPVRLGAPHHIQSHLIMPDCTNHVGMCVNSLDG